MKGLCTNQVPQLLRLVPLRQAPKTTGFETQQGLSQDSKDYSKLTEKPLLKGSHTVSLAPKPRWEGQGTIGILSSDRSPKWVPFSCFPSKLLKPVGAIFFFFLSLWVPSSHSVMCHNHFSSRGELLYLYFEANVTLISKPVKVITKKENYRPISLINIDVKIFSKILEN